MTLLLACLAASACGRKGPPLPPLSRVPAPIDDVALRRLGDDVYVTFTVPSENVDASRPSAATRVDLFALTAAEPPSRDAFLTAATRIASVAVAPPEAGTDPASPDRPGGGGAEPVGQGARVTIRDSLRPVPPPPAPAPGAGTPDPSARVRYYLAVGVGGGRTGAGGRLAGVPAGPGPPAPGTPDVTSTRDQLQVRWSGAGADALYNVYAADNGPISPRGDEPPDLPPAPLNETPLTAAAWDEPVVFDRERCFRVRALRHDEGGAAVESEPSPRACHTPEDVFPPAAPADLDVVSGPDGIELRWTASREPDVAGYLILRGAPGDVTLLPVTDEPVIGTRYLDRAVEPGMRYVYAVVAVDSRQPVPNRSAESARDAATAR